MTDTETTPQAGPQALADARRRYRQLAPVPDPSAADPGTALGRHLAAAGLRRAGLARDSCDDAEAARVAMAAAMLWHRLSAADPDYAWVTAGQIATAWNDGDGVGEWLHTLAGQFGIDAAEVNGIAQFEALHLSTRQADAEKTAREMAAALKLAQDAVEALGKLADSHERVLYAASVDLARDDPDGARALLWEQLDGFDGEPAGENETGMQYLNRMRAKRKAEAAAEAKPEPQGM
jgi:hypothetical protein